MKFLLLFGIKVYQFVMAPLLKPSCRHYPSCSRYTAEAIREHGAWRGSKLGVARILRCRPGVPPAYDPVPPPPPPT